MRIEHKVVMRISDDERGLLGEFSRDEQLPADITHAFDACASGTLLLAADQSEVILAFGGVAQAAGFYVEGDGPVRLRIGTPGGATQSLGLAAAEAGQRAKIFATAQVASLAAFAANAGQAVRIRYAVWGAATAST